MNLEASNGMKFVIAAEVVLLLLSPIPRSMPKQRADRIVRQITIVEDAASTMYARGGEWPEDAPEGECPDSLKALLPKGLAFRNDSYTLDWDHWKLAEERGPDEFVGISVIERDPRVLARVVADLGARRMHFSLGNRAVFVIDPPPVVRPAPSAEPPETPRVRRGPARSSGEYQPPPKQKARTPQRSRKRH
jgi:hypothetical protein